MAEQVSKGRRLSERQQAAVLHCKARRDVPAKAAPVPSAEPTQAHTGGLSLALASGHYAGPGEDGALRFIKVDALDDGKWAGWTFVKIQASDEYHRLGSQKPGGTYHGKSADLLSAISADPAAAGALYGTALGKCYRCNRTLTDQTSREMGIGPECRQKV